MQSHGQDTAGDGDDFGSVAWETAPTASTAAEPLSASQGDLQDVTQYQSLGYDHQSDPTSVVASSSHPDPHPSLSNTPVHSAQVKDGKVELEGTSETFVSYLVTAKTDLPIYTSKAPSSRRRFQDFVFMRDLLTRDFPACVVPPLPDKHRMEYVVGDRFSADFIERRRVDLQRFLERLSRHPKLSRTSIFQNFLESTEWNVYKHKQLANSSDPEPPSGLLDNLSDTLLNAFTKVKKPDERFVEIRANLDQFEEGLASIERLGARSKTRLGDLSGDYEDMAMSVQGLGYLESGITDPLMRFERALVEFGSSVRENAGMASDPFLEHLHSLLAYSASFKSVLKLRDQKQLDFEELSQYLSNVATERDRLAGGYGYGMGLGSYFKEKVESLRGGEADGSKEARLIRLDAKIKELQDAVIHSQDTSQAFNEEVLAEHAVFRLIKRAEMKELLGSFADGQIAMHKASQAAWDKMIPKGA
ncbi:hypothetical protein BCR35DRAFT_279224 [Leucosporidium creatinivorum]|uniref:Sorting nexin-4 n=1 Tax=Leucosporidium creatinivorum TaxID=106004 RepID=A0A1Y2F8P8_9BASI|nr:hypothetical protein BCR35DRAFT_279224 [Leucosporidium creatinivorum]